MAPEISEANARHREAQAIAKKAGVYGWTMRQLKPAELPEELKGRKFLATPSGALYGVGPHGELRSLDKLRKTGRRRARKALGEPKLSRRERAEMQRFEAKHLTQGRADGSGAHIPATAGPTPAPATNLGEES